PDDAVATSVRGASPYVPSASGANVIVWPLLPMAMLEVAVGAAAKFASPGWSPLTVQVPVSVIVTCPALIVQGPVTPRTTARPEVAAPLTVNGASPKTLFAGRVR